MKEFIDKFISDREIEPNRFSCLVIAIIDARKITGRDLKTGEHKLNILGDINAFIDPFSFIGVINYLLILDLIGEVFKTNSTVLDEKKPSKIYKALKHFSSTSEHDIDTIIALRNCLAHNYGLINIPSSKEIATKQHKFTLDNSETSDLIIYPSNGNWSGDFNDKSPATSTKVSTKLLIDLVESVYSDIQKKHKEGNLHLALTKGIDELKARFTIRN